jgi:hypothetical protein
LDAGTGLTTDGGANAFTIDISNTSADAGDLASIHAKTSLTVALDKVTTLTGTFTELKQYITDEAQYTSKNAVTTVTIDAQAIDGSGSNGTVAELITFHTDIRDTGDSHGTPSVNLTNVTLLSGDLSDLNSVRTTGTFTGKGAVDYTAGDTSITITEANTLSGATTGKVTATIANDALADLIGAGGIAADTGNDGSQINAFTVTLTDTSVTAANLATLDARTSGTINLDSVDTISGTFTELKAFIAAEDNFGNKDKIVNVNFDAQDIDGSGSNGTVAQLLTFHTDIRDNTGDGFNSSAVNFRPVIPVASVSVIADFRSLTPPLRRSTLVKSITADELKPSPVLSLISVWKVNNCATVPLLPLPSIS